MYSWDPLIKKANWNEVVSKSSSILPWIPEMAVTQMTVGCLISRSPSVVDKEMGQIIEI